MLLLHATKYLAGSVVSFSQRVGSGQSNEEQGVAGSKPGLKGTAAWSGKAGAYGAFILGV